MHGPHHVAVKSTATSLPSGFLSALANSSGVSSCRTMQSVVRSTVLDRFAHARTTRAWCWGAHLSLIHI